MFVNYMREAKETGNKEQFTMQINGFSRDLLTKYKGKNLHAENGDEEEEEIELSLGLSLNGKFGLDPKREAKQKLMRSSSIASFMLIDDKPKEDARVMPCIGYAPLMRTCSLPAEPEEEWRKRKEMQTQRRKEVKRKRMEKKNVRVVRGKVDFVEESGVTDSINGDGSVSNGEEQGLVGSHVINGNETCNGNNNINDNGLQSSQGSLGSQGSGTSGISDLEAKPMQGANKSTEVRSPSSAQPLPKQGEQKTGLRAAEKEMKETLRNAMLDMPCVSARGDGPNGKKIDGFLYRYGKGEEVSIVCVCHGSFLSPAEFVKHAGGQDVAHPLRHIVVNPSPFL